MPKSLANQMKNFDNEKYPTNEDNFSINSGSKNASK